MCRNVAGIILAFLFPLGVFNVVAPAASHKEEPTALTVKQKFRFERGSDDGAGRDLAFTKDGGFLAVREKNLTIIYDLGTGKEKVRFTTTPSRGIVEFAPDGKHLRTV